MKEREIKKLIKKLNDKEIENCPFPSGFLNIDLEKLETNILKIKKFSQKISKKNNIKFLLPIKANAYGHGMIPIAKFIEYKNICEYFGVAHLGEAIQLRKNGIKNKIIILGQSFCEKEDIKAIVENKFEPSVSSENLLFALNNEAKKMKKIVNVHVSVDTGIGREGIIFEEITDFLDKLKNCKNINLLGVMTHFSVADENKKSSIKYTKKQIEIFNDLKNVVEKIFSQDIIFHCANSGGAIGHCDSIFNMIRPGIAVYGYPEYDLGINLNPVMELKTKVSLVKKYPEGFSIGYGRTYQTKEKNEYLALVPIGYGDGLSRLLSNKLEVIIKGRKRKNVGRISMDQFTVKVSRNVQVGDEVVIIGKQEKNFLSAREMALQVNSISYEALCNLGNAKRIRHRYFYGTVV